MTPGTIACLLDDCAGIMPGRPLLRDVSGKTWTVSEVADLSSAATGWLRSAGVRPGMTVAWQLPSNVNAAVLMLALSRMAVVQAPVLHLYRQREVRAAVEVAAADVLLVDESTVESAPAGVRTVVVPPDLSERLRGVDAADPAPAETRSEPGWVYFTEILSRPVDEVVSGDLRFG